MILFNRESPRRNFKFCNNKSNKAAVEIKLGLKKNYIWEI